MLSKLMEDKKTIAVSGTHGKTTTTGLIATMMQNSEKYDPTTMIGGNLPSIQGNIKSGTDNYFVTEADESDGSLLYFDPYISVVTNIELEHLDFYTNKKKLQNTFKNFINKTAASGKSIVCAEDKIIRELIDLDNDKIISYGFENGKIRANNINYLPFGSLFDVEFNNKKIGEINLQIPGKYNILNSLAAIAVGLYLGLSFTEIKKGIEKFSGVKRRFEKKALIKDVLIIDDYAHHPTEIKETLKAAVNTGFNRVIAIFQPHRYSRTKYLFKEFCNSFSDADRLIITDVYSADEKIKDEEDKYLAKNMAEECSKIYDFKVEYIKNLSKIPDYLNSIIESRDIVITIGAGDIYKSGEKLIKIMKTNTWYNLSSRGDYLNYRLIAILTIIFIGLGVFFSLIYSPSLEIKDFNVKGNEVLKTDEIINNINKFKNKNILLVNIDELRKSLLAREKYIKDVIINKIYPNKLEIIITERKPIAKIVNDKKTLVFDNEGYILEQGKNDIKADVPLLKGVGYSFSKNRIVFTPSFEKLVQELEDLKFSLIKELNLIQYKQLQNNKFRVELLIMNNNIKVKLGDLENLAKKFKILEATILDIKKNNLKVDYINLQYPDKPVYKTEN